MKHTLHIAFRFYYYSIMWLVCMSCSVIPVLSYGQSTDKVDPTVWAQLSQQGEADVLVLFSDQLAPTRLPKGKNKTEKGRMVHSFLLAQNQQQNRTIEGLQERAVYYRPFIIFNMIHTIIDEATLMWITTLPEVHKIISNAPIRVEEPISVSDISHRSIEWGIQNIHADSVWQQFGVQGQGVVIGGQDTGYEWDHPAIKVQYRGWKGGQVEHSYNWHDAIRGAINGGVNSCGYQLSVPCDDHSHGTHTMGTMVGDDGGTNQIGVAPQAQWIGCRNMEEGDGTLATYAECFEWFLAPYAYGEGPRQGQADLAPHVINNSWACPTSEGCNTGNYYILDSIVNTLRAAGIVVVVSAGNYGSSCGTVRTPAAIFEGSFSVGATRSNDNIASFSSRGPVTVDGSNRRKPDISAPGVSVRSSVLNGGYASYSGTSMAGPHVAGTVALLISANQLLAGEVELIEQILEQTARPMYTSQACGGDGPNDIPNHVYGYGIIDAYAAVQQAIAILNIRLADFYGFAKQSGNQLYWITNGEHANSHFIVQRSEDGWNWENIGRVEGGGNTSSKRKYTFLDPSPFRQTFYRLEQWDESGDLDYSPTIRLHREGENQIISLAPNPVKDILTCKVPGDPQLFDFSLRLTDSRGLRAFQAKIVENQIAIPVPPGLYYYQIIDPIGMIVQSGKLLVVN